MDRILSTYSYGICLFSMEVLQDFLKKEKIRMDKKAKRKGIDPNKKDRTKHQGKFSAKYSERIQSIKDSDKERPKKIEK